MVEQPWMRYVLLALLVVLGIWALSQFPTPEAAGAYSLSHIEVARTAAAREQGLSGRDMLPEDYGMLFIFPAPGDYGFWMKDMKVAIDIIWLADDGTILGSAQSVAPETYPTTFHPPTPVRYALEVAAGTMEAKGWENGTKLSLPLE